MILLIFSILVALVYVWWAFNVFAGWKNYQGKEAIATAAKHGISIVVAFRNEANNLPVLLSSLKALNYPKEKIELFFVNDNSLDDSVDVVRKWMTEVKFHVQLLESNVPGKKAAQYLGVKSASFEIIACTDADCQLPTNWLHKINESFFERETELVFGAVEILGTDKPIQRLEFLSLIGSTIAMLTRGWGVMGNAANMAFRKQTYLDVFPRLEQRTSASGDDVFLLHEVAKRKGSINVLQGADAVVKTLPQPDLKSLLMQRMRWASKTKHYASKKAVGIALLIFGINTILLLQLFGVFYSFRFLVSFLLLFIIKTAADYVLLRSFAKFYKHQFKISIFLLQEFINLIYIPLVAILSQLAPFTWKGRKY